MAQTQNEDSMRDKKLGIWLFGAGGSIATSTIAGASSLSAEAVEPIGLVTEREPFKKHNLVACKDMCFGGCDVKTVGLTGKLDQLISEGSFPPHLRSIASEGLAAAERRIVGSPLSVTCEPQRSAADKIRAVHDQIEAFRALNNLDDVIAVNLCSTEPLPETRDSLWSHNDWASLQGFLEEPLSLASSGVIYAVAALHANCPYINFTPNVDMELPALQELAMKKKLPHAGKDGKTGETLLKAVLAPMFEDRALRILAWEGKNILGGEDGRTLKGVDAKRTKLLSKDLTLEAICSNPSVHIATSIDYVPSLAGWKTAWDFIHFEGFLGTRMSMQFTWQGCDSILAAPLILDLVRLVACAARCGEVGHLGYLDCFFKSPTVRRSFDFKLQFQQLLERFK